MVVSPLALTVPTWAISFGSFVDLLIFLSSPTRDSTALSMPRLISIGVVTRGDELAALAEDGLREHGGGGGAVASDVTGLRGHFAHHLGAHVLELVLELDLLGDGHAVLGDRGWEPKLFSITTLRPLGPSVTFTASASALTPARIRLRAVSL